MKESNFKQYDIGEIISNDNFEYIIMETLELNNNNYFFTCKLKDNDVTNEYYIFKMVGDELLLIKDINMESENLLSLFENKLKGKITNLMKSNN